MYESVAKLPCGEVTVAKLPCGEVTGNLFRQGFPHFYARSVVRILHPFTVEMARADFFEAQTARGPEPLAQQP